MEDHKAVAQEMLEELRKGSRNPLMHLKCLREELALGDLKPEDINTSNEELLLYQEPMF
jgi:hypothetical protein